MNELYVEGTCWSDGCVEVWVPRFRLQIVTRETLITLTFYQIENFLFWSKIYDPWLNSFFDKSGAFAAVECVDSFDWNFSGYVYIEKGVFDFKFLSFENFCIFDEAVIFVSLDTDFLKGWLK